MRFRDRLLDGVLRMVGVEVVPTVPPRWPPWEGLQTHTPGPWRVIDRWNVEIFGGDHEAVAQIFWDRDRAPVCRANERLIVLAPEMLEALIAYEEAFILCGAGSGFEKEIQAAQQRFDDLRQRVFERLQVHARP